MNLVNRLIKIGQFLPLRITLYTSPRTPRYFEEIIEQLVLQKQYDFISIIDYKTHGVGSVTLAFEADAIIVTQDSASMITEAVVSRRPVIILSPRSHLPSPDDEIVSYFEKMGCALSIQILELNKETILSALSILVPLHENHLDILARNLSLHINI